MEKAHFPVGHETGVMILFGIAASYVIRYVARKNCHQLEDIVVLNWSNNNFFCVLLPLIVFATGFNIRRRKFFQNIANTVKFGLLGTLLTFIFYSLLTIAAFEVFDFVGSVAGVEDKTEIFKLSYVDIFYLCSILSSSDIIAAVTLVKYD